MPCSLATKVNSFHVIFDLNKILIATCFDRGFSIVIMCPRLKDFLKKCLAQFQVYIWFTPSSSLMDSTTNPKVKRVEEGVGACSLACNTLGVEGRAEAPKSRLGRLTKNSITNTDLHNQTTNWLVRSLGIFGAHMSHEQTQTHKIHRGPNLQEATTFPLIVYYVPGHVTNTQMSFCLGTPN
jgi:hypothetical protein